MSKIILFYIGDNSFGATIVHGNAFSLVDEMKATKSHDQIVEFINHGAKNNGYYWNTVSNRYEFWQAGKMTNKIDTTDDLINRYDHVDGVFVAHSDLLLVPVSHNFPRYL